jgi:putative salt-induced outer membrane protein
MTIHHGRMGRHSIAACALLAISLPAAAQWTGKGEAGLAVSDGNSASTTANAKITIGKKVHAWEHGFGLAGLYVRSEGETSAERWESFLKTRYSFGSGRTYWFGGARYEQDEFSGFNYQGVLDTGAGHKLIDSEKTKLTAQVGIGYKFWQTLETLEAPRDEDGSVAGTAGADFSHQLTDSTSLFNKFGAEVTSDNNFLQNEAGVAVKVSDRLALSLGYTVRHNTDPPEGFRKTDTLSTVNLVYEVK